MKGWSKSRVTRRALLQGSVLSEGSNTVSSAAVKLEDIGQTEDAEMLDEAHKKFRSWAATFIGMSLDRTDVQYAAKEVWAKMAHPALGSRKRLKKYLWETWTMRSWRRDDEVNTSVYSAGQRVSQQYDVSHCEWPKDYSVQLQVWVRHVRWPDRMWCLLAMKPGVTK